MPGWTKDENSLSSGIPDRNIGPETGSFGNATKTNTADTGEGTNQDHEGRPAPAAGIGGSRLTTNDVGERRSFDSGTESDVDFPESDVEPVYQQIADGGDHFDHDKHLHEKETRRDEKLRDQELTDEERIARRDRPLT
ncbi:MAG TPA: hypothetical protein VGM25_01490 [Caulobacteraceae bacterium]|jgi:hypothetical protein